jgi:hypothetical protein
MLDGCQRPVDDVAADGPPARHPLASNPRDVRAIAEDHFTFSDTGTFADNVSNAV